MGLAEEDEKLFVPDSEAFTPAHVHQARKSLRFSILQLPHKSILKVPTLRESLGTTSTSSLSHKSSNISFGDVEVREHAYILGCNPSVEEGPPLTIGWESVRTSQQTVDDFEAHRPPAKKPDWLLRKSATERHNMLKDEGFTSVEMSMVVDEIERIKLSREQTKAERSSSELGAVMAQARRRKQQASKKKNGSGGILRMFRRHKVPA